MNRLTLLPVIALLAAITFLITRRSDSDAPPTPPTQTAGKTKPPLSAESPAAAAKLDPASLYTKGPKSRDGIGKFYLGREISHVMGHPAMAWLERSSRESEEAPNEAIKLINLRPGEVIADIGAGSGYYSFRLAAKHPQARIVAIDIQEEMLGFLEQHIAKNNTQNVITHLGKIDSIDLPAGSLDAALMVDAYHEFSHPYEMIRSIVSALRPGGRLYLLEYRKEDPTVAIKPLHKMTEAQAKKEMEFAGLEWVETLDDLPWQHFMIFRKPS